MPRNTTQDPQEAPKGIVIPSAPKATKALPADVVKALTGGPFTGAEVARAIGVPGLAFRNHMRAAADAEVKGSVARCGRGRTYRMSAQEARRLAASYIEAHGKA